jgi:hypothetical protein
MGLRWCFLWLWMGSMGWAQASGPEAPSADAVVARLVERLKSLPDRHQGQAHVCRRMAVIETLDSDGSVSERKTKEYVVAMTNGVETVRLVRVDEKEPPAADARSEERRDREARERYGKSGSFRKRRGVEVVDEALLRRFEYTWQGFEVIAGRTNHVLRFAAKPSEPGQGGSQGFADRLMSLLEGRLWIDAEEHELVRVEAGLGRSFDVFAGVVASIQRMSLLIERFRLPDGRWVDGRFHTALEGRKFLSTLRLRLQVEQDRYETASMGPG